MTRLRGLLWAGLAAASLAGCGQRGPLYLPEPETPPAGTAPATEPEQGDEGDDER